MELLPVKERHVMLKEAMSVLTPKAQFVRLFVEVALRKRVGNNNCIHVTGFVSYFACRCTNQWGSIFHMRGGNQSSNSLFSCDLGAQKIADEKQKHRTVSTHIQDENAIT